MQPEVNPIAQWYAAQQWREVTDVPLDDPPFFAASAYIATMSDPDDTDRRDRLIDCFMALARRLAGGTPGIRRRDIDRALNRASRRINIRLRAADIAARVMIEQGSTPALRFETARSVREAIASEKASMKIICRITKETANRSSLPRKEVERRPARPFADEAFPHEYQRMWKPSLPVLALALSLRSEIMTRTKNKLSILPQISFSVASANFKHGKPDNLIILRAT